MRFDIITLFPDLFAPHLALGVTRRAFESRQVDVRLWPLRDFADNAYRRVDDRPYGGGPGMVMLVEPLDRALAAIRADRGGVGVAPVVPGTSPGLPGTSPSVFGTSAGVPGADLSSPPSPLVHFSPTGRRIDQALVREFASGNGAVLLCGRYEGIDQRFVDRHVDLELSLGDFVVSGGELPALALLDAVARLQPGVLGDAESHRQDSFSDGLLDCPHYSRPEVWQVNGSEPVSVPAALLSGHHAQIARWRRERSLQWTAERRPDLIAAARVAGRLSAADEAFLQSLHL